MTGTDRAPEQSPVLVEIQGTDGRAINSLDDWRRWGGPKRTHQWQPRACAMELARAWCERDASPASSAPAMPIELIDLLESSPRTRGFRPSQGFAEHVTRLDDFRGEHRNHDLVLVGANDRDDQLVIAIEAKALESFGSTTVSGQIAAGRARAGSNIEARVTFSRRRCSAARCPTQPARSTRVWESCATRSSPPASARRSRQRHADARSASS